MLINEVISFLEATATKAVAIYPGRFHPFHKGHKFVYDYLSSKYSTAYIATSDKQGPDSPFSFEEKKRMMMLTGVPASAIVNTRQPYVPNEILDQLDAKTTAAVFGVGKKDMDEGNPRFKVGLKKNGEPTYYQHNKDSRETYDVHGYLDVVPTQKFKVLGEPATSATELRRQYATLDDTQAQQFITDLFGAFDQQVMSTMDQKLGRK
jgi:nicotinamide mononucleotide adenylyltransferase